MQKELNEIGAHIDQFYYCPFHKDGIIAEYAIDSNDRKPNIGMLDKVSRDWNLDKKNLTMVGDRESDIQCAKKFGIKNFLYNGVDNLVDCFNSL